MSFVRVLPSGWVINGKLTSAQANQLDTQQASAIDKTGDTVPGGATITWAAGSFLTVAGTLTASGTLQNAAGTISMSGNTLTVSGAGQVLVQNSASIVLTGAGTILKTTAGGRIQLADSDYPTFSATRSLVRVIDLAQTNYFGSGWATSTDGLVAPVNAGGTAKQAIVPLYPPHNGATIASIELFFTPLAGHAGTPATNIALALLTRQVLSGVVLPARTLFTTASAYSPVSLADYNDTLVKSVTATTGCVVDNTAYEYALQITDEGGANSLGQTVFHQAKVTYSGIADMRFA